MSGNDVRSKDNPKSSRRNHQPPKKPVDNHPHRKSRTKDRNSFSTGRQLTSNGNAAKPKEEYLGHEVQVKQPKIIVKKSRKIEIPA